MLDQTRFPDAAHWACANFSGVDLGLSARVTLQASEVAFWGKVGSVPVAA